MSLPASDREIFDNLSREELYDYLDMQVRNIWRVDGLYFLGIQKRHDMQEATDVDAECWAYMGKVEARELRDLLKVTDPGPAEVLHLLRYSSWAVSHHLKSWEITPEGDAVFTVEECRTQLIRQEKKLGEHPCRQVRENYLINFAKELNPQVKVECVSCPPGRSLTDIWCRWRFVRAA
ncbi:MAG: hypothetical protein KQJ78_09395 [Deltaproteobacteria bacterium]|nr:hypothetical protein [Deltaproteobacteria bacterium]